MLGKTITIIGYLEKMKKPKLCTKCGARRLAITTPLFLHSEGTKRKIHLCSSCVTGVINLLIGTVYDEGQEKELALINKMSKYNQVG